MNISCSYKLFTLYGPIAIHSYGLFICLGIIISIGLMRLNQRFIQLKLDKKIADIISVSIIAAIIGGRIAEIISEPNIYQYWQDYFSLWNGGLSALGGIIGVTTIMPFYLKKVDIPILPMFDLTAIYAPLLQSIARLGCLAAGCCHGITTSSIFNIVYTNHETIAQYGIPLIPTQLYSSIALFLIFLLMFFIVQKICKQPGEIFCIYLILAGLERLVIDFWRADRIMQPHSYLSSYQYIALGLIMFSITLYSIIIWHKRLTKKKPLKTVY